MVQSLVLDSAIKVVGEASSGTEALELVREHCPDLVLLDISMPGDGIERIRDILRLPRPPRVVMLTVSQQDDDIVRSLEAGRRRLHRQGHYGIGPYRSGAAYRGG